MPEQTNLSHEDVSDLRALAASSFRRVTTYGVPGADDDDLRRHLPQPRSGSRRCLSRACRPAGAVRRRFADLDAERRKQVANDFREKGGNARRRSSASCCNATTATTAC